MKAFAESFYTGKSWKDCRKAFAKSKGGLCERCLAKGYFKAGDIVHHKIPITAENINRPEITMNWNNLELLCRDCHAEVHGKNKKNRRYEVDEFGRVTAKD